MPLLSAPLPRMAGKLTFMRSPERRIDELHSGDLAVLGLPFEDFAAPHAGQQLAARAIRETSVYFGWHVNPQFSHPVDIDSRSLIETAGLHERLSDVGDLAADQVRPANALSRIACAIFQRDACLVMLGGPRLMSELARLAIGACPTVQMGGVAADPTAFHIAPLINAIGARHVVVPGQVRPLEMSSVLSSWCQGQAPIFLHLDLSVFSASLSAICDQPRLGGCGLSEITGWMAALGHMQVAAVHVTGLNPTRPGMGVVKVGQRLVVTALLPFIYARLGFLVDAPPHTTHHEQVQ